MAAPKKGIQPPGERLRPVYMRRGISKHAEGSALIMMGNTVVLCTASVEEKVPDWLKGRGRGWVTAEYGMLPRSTASRIPSGMAEFFTAQEYLLPSPRPRGSTLMHREEKFSFPAMTLEKLSVLSMTTLTDSR